jgi:hypothetical protein
MEASAKIIKVKTIIRIRGIKKAFLYVFMKSSILFMSYVDCIKLLWVFFAGDLGRC